MSETVGTVQAADHRGTLDDGGRMEESDPLITQPESDNGNGNGKAHQAK